MHCNVADHVYTAAHELACWLAVLLRLHQDVTAQPIHLIRLDQSSAHVYTVLSLYICIHDLYGFPAECQSCGNR